MDALDYQILSCLKENSRENATNIGNKINLSTSAVIERIKKLEAAEVISQYTMLINPSATGRELIAFISVRLEHPSFNDSFIDNIKANHHVTECHYIAGDFDFLLKVVTTNSKKLESMLNYIKGIKGVSLTRTSVVLSTNKNEVCVLPEIE